MLTLLMCGGRGTRLGRGEKPMLEVCGMRLVDHSLLQYRDFEVIAVTSPYTPETEKYLAGRGVEIYRSAGKGYIEDYGEACRELSIDEPVIVASADIVYIRDLAFDIVRAYMRSIKPALTVIMNGEPVGVNVIDPILKGWQEEEIYIIEKDSLVNVNTFEDVKRAEMLWNTMRGERDLRKD
uniref:TIGR00454 family protein n=1 Tax=Archaeoglobus fulgidus TaxID=2234 RepID=A0A7C2SPZ1_ARCFL